MRADGDDVSAASSAESRGTGRSGFSYDVFLSYSYGDTRELAVALQAGLERLARPRGKLRALRVFRDDANLTASPQLWSSLEAALAASRWFVLLASPGAAKSPWVEREVAWWLRNRSARHLLIATADPGLIRDKRAYGGSLVAAVPPALQPLVADKPRVGDLSGAFRHRGQLRLPDESVADVAAAIHGRSKDALIGDHLRQRRNRRRVAGSALTGLAILAAAVVVVTTVAFGQHHDANAQAQIALSRQLVSEALAVQGNDPALARQLIIEAYKQSPTAQARGALLTALSLPGSISVPPSISSPYGAAMAYSPDSRYLAAGIAGKVRIFEPSSGKLVAQLPSSSGEIGAVAFSPDGHLLAVGDGFGDNGMSLPGHIRIWEVSDLAHPRLLVSIKSSWAIGFLAFSPDGHELSASGGLPGQPPKLWNVTKPSRPVEYPNLAHGNGITGSLIFSPHSNALLNISEDGALTLWQRTSSEQLVHPFVFPGKPDHGAFSADGHLLAAPTSSGQIQLWRVAQQGPPKNGGQFDAGVGTASNIAFVGASGDVLMVMGTGVSFWDVSNPADPVSLNTLTPPNGISLGDTMAVSPDGRYLATCTDSGLVSLWNITDPTPSGALSSAPPPRFIVGNPMLRPDHWTIMTSGDDASARTVVYLWDLANPAQPLPLAMRVVGVGSDGIPAFSPADRILAVGYNSSLATASTYLWDMSHPRSPVLLNRIAGLGAQDLAFSPDGRILAAAFTAGAQVIHEAYQLWDVSDPRRPRLLSQFAEPPGLIGDNPTFSRDGRFLAADLNGNGFDVWDISDPHRPVSVVRVDERNGYFTFTSDDRLLVGNSTGVFRVWDLTRSGVKSAGGMLLVDPTNTYGAIAVSPDGTLAAIQERHTLGVWDISVPGDAVLLAELPTTGAPLAFSPRGSFLVTGLDGGGIQLWDMSLSDIEHRLCQNIGTPMTVEQWHQYLPGQPFTPPCRS